MLTKCSCAAYTQSRWHDRQFSPHRSSSSGSSSQSLYAASSWWGYTTADWKTMWTELAVMPWALSIRSTWTLCEHEETTLSTCLRMDSVLDMVTPSIFIMSARQMHGRVGGCWNVRLRLVSVNTISRDLARLSVKLLVCDQASTCANSSSLLSTLTDGIMI